MNQPGLEELLSIENSRRNTDLIADLILKKPEFFVDLFQIYIKNKEPLSRRAAWVIDVVTDKLPDMILPYLEEIALKVSTFSHDGMKRESLKILSRSPLPVQHLGNLINICFDWLTSGKESVAVKMFSMELLYRISQQEPELKKELADSIEWRMEEESPGFKAHGRKLLKRLSAELKDY